MDAEMFFREYPTTEPRLRELVNRSTPAILDWIGNYNRLATIRLALVSIHEFLDYHHLTAEQLIELAKQDSKRVKTMITELVHYLRLKGKASYSTYNNVTFVRSLLRFNDIQLQVPRTTIARSPEFEEYYKPTNEEVQKMIHHAPIVRDKAVLAFLYQTGQRVSMVGALRWGKVRQEIEQKKFPAIIEVPANLKTYDGKSANKLGRRYYMVIPFETCQYLEAMIEERKRWGEKITDDVWLFRTYSVRSEKGNPTKLDKNEPALNAMGNWVVKKIIDRSAKVIGIFAKNEKRTKIHPHSFRRSFETALDDKLSENLLKFIMGRAIPMEVAHGIPSEKRGAYKIYEKEYIREQWIRNDCDMALNLGTSKELIEAYKIVDMMKTSGMGDDEVAEVYELLRSFKSPEEAMNEIRKRAEDAMRLKLFNQADGGTRKSRMQKIVDENELPELLNQGFEITTVLPSGKIVVKQ